MKTNLSLYCLLAAIGFLSSEWPCAVAANPAGVRWDFEGADRLAFVSPGQPRRQVPGPRPPEFPEMAADNRAVAFQGNGDRLEIADPGPQSPLDFGQGDPLTIEAWVRVDNAAPGQQMYLIGKGRTGNPGFARDNQNWALRVVAEADRLRLSFLFATAAGEGSSHWHRWTSQLGFPLQSGWHHVAVAYQFGRPDSIRGWIDGQASGGQWDLGGPTKQPPVVDDDAVWIGSALAGNPANSLRGAIDQIVLHRALLTDKQVAGRFRRVGGPRVIGPAPQAMPELSVADGKVLVTLAEGAPSHARWLNQGEAWPDESQRWQSDVFLLPRMPLRYDSWGIRDAWQAPVLLRMAADVSLSPGPRTFLLRARGLGRLWVDGKLVAQTAAVTKSPPNGEEPVTPVAVPPAPGTRPAGYHQQEVLGSAKIAASGRSRVVLELIVGGKNQRTETGEVLVAVRNPDDDQYQLLRPAGRPPIALSDASVEPKLAELRRGLDALDTQTRRRAAAQQDAFWQTRHALARAWAGQHPPRVSLPEAAQVADSRHAGRAIDAFLDAKRRRVRQRVAQQDPRQAAEFHGQVLPLLRQRCFQCHGQKRQGGLRLTTRQEMLAGGDSGEPAIVPGKPRRSPLLERVASQDPAARMPPDGEPLNAAQRQTLTRWIEAGAPWPAPPVAADDLEPAPLIDDFAFIRRAHLDTVGVPPSADEVRQFVADTRGDKRERLIERLVDDPRLADHWMSSYLDLLAENPTLLNSSLNSTGPFRWFLYDAFRDGKSLDRIVTELLMMRGGVHTGGSAGFGLAAENDAPLAAKAHILAAAFLGIELQCARCHDSPYNSATQRDLYSLAAMLDRKPASVPGTSAVPAAFFEAQNDRQPLIEVTLPPGEPVPPAWPFADVTGVADGPELDALLQNPADVRERLAALITAPHNRRFAEVLANRVWQRLMGTGIVEPATDWELAEPSHPELLQWLGHQLTRHDYDPRWLVRAIMNSQAWQRAPTGRNAAAAAEVRLFSAPERRRLTAEQIVDALHTAAGVAMDVEELTFVHDGLRPLSNRQTLGTPQRAWMFASLANERDRPSLSLPKARAVADVLEAFGWTGSRQQPRAAREGEPNVLQPGILANGTLTRNLTRAAHGSPLAELAVTADDPGQLLDALMLRFLNRLPTRSERQQLVPALADGFPSRLVPAAQVQLPPPRDPLPLVTWFNHLQAEANEIQLEVERRVRAGPPPDPRLQAAWREVYEDVIWSLVNTRDFVWMP